MIKVVPVRATTVFRYLLNQWKRSNPKNKNEIIDGRTVDVTRGIPLL
jgi:hypothetical protein